VESGSRLCFRAQRVHTRATAAVESTRTPSISANKPLQRICIITLASKFYQMQGALLGRDSAKEIGLAGQAQENKHCPFNWTFPASLLIKPQGLYTLTLSLVSQRHDWVYSRCSSCRDKTRQARSSDQQQDHAQKDWYIK